MAAVDRVMLGDMAEWVDFMADLVPRRGLEKWTLRTGFFC